MGLRDVEWPSIKWPPKPNVLQLMVISFLIVSMSLSLYLDYRQYNYLKTITYPVEFMNDKYISEEKWVKAVDMKRTYLIIGFVYEIFDKFIDIFIVLFGLLPWLWSQVPNAIYSTVIKDSSRPIRAEVYRTACFMLAISIINVLIKLPFQIINALIRDEAFMKLFEIFFSLPLSLYIGFSISLLFYKVIISLWHHFGALILAIKIPLTLALVFVFEIVHALLTSFKFGIFKALGDDEFGRGAKELATKLGYKPTNITIFKFSNVVNAYCLASFIPWFDRIVFFKGILDIMTPEQLLAVLAHELGHWFHSHSSKATLFGLTAEVMLAVAFFYLCKRPILKALGFEQDLRIPQSIETPTESKQVDCEKQAEGEDVVKQESTENHQIKEKAPPQLTKDQQKEQSIYKSKLGPFILFSIAFSYLMMPFNDAFGYLMTLDTHLSERQADVFGVQKRGKASMLSCQYALHRPRDDEKSYSDAGVSEPFYDHLTRTHPTLLNRLRYIEATPEQASGAL